MVARNKVLGSVSYATCLRGRSAAIVLIFVTSFNKMIDKFSAGEFYYCQLFNFRLLLDNFLLPKGSLCLKKLLIKQMNFVSTFR